MTFALIFSTQFLGILGAILFAPNFVLNLDKTILDYVQSFETPFLTAVFSAVTFLGDKYFVAPALAAAVLILFYLKMKKEALFLLVSSAGAQALVFLLKNIVGRSRPDFNILTAADGFSFPSGHSIAAVAFYGALAYVLLGFFRQRDIQRSKNWRKRLTIFAASVFILLIGLSRIYLGAHWPSDVLGSFTLGVCWLIFSVYVCKKFLPR